MFKIFLKRIKSSIKGFDYQIPPTVLSALSSDLVEPVDWASAELETNEMESKTYSIWKKIPEGFKWIHYFPIYDEILSPLRSKPIRFLEIGVYRGASLQMWREYLHKDSTIVGIDIDPSCSRFNNPAQRIHVEIGGQQDKNFLRDLVQKYGPFDVILDDGSHVVSHMIDTFNYLFLNGLNDPGIYIVEDLHSNVWKSHRDLQYSFIDLMKELVDLMHAHYRDLLSPNYFCKGHEKHLLSIKVPKITTMIDSIQFHDSISVVRKKTKKLPLVVHL